MRIHLIYALLLTVALCACGEDSISPNGTDTPTDPNNKGNVDSNFVLLSKDNDSLYWGEEVGLTIKGVAVSDTLLVFIHSLPAPITHVEPNAGDLVRIRVRVPLNAESGQIRVYKRQTIQALGTLSLTVIKQDFSSIKPAIYTVSPTDGYVGESFAVTGVNLPLRRRDIEIKIGTVVLPIDSVTPTRISASITNNVQSGQIWVKVMGIEKSFGEFTRLEHEGAFLAKGTMSRIEFNLEGLLFDNRRIENSGAQSFGEGGGEVMKQFNFRESVPAQISDSIILIYTNGGGSTSEVVEIRLKSEPESRVSGTIRTMSVRGADDTTITEITLHGMRWKKKPYRYLLYASREEMLEQLVKVRVEVLRRSARVISEYKGVGTNPVCWMQLYE